MRAASSPSDSSALAGAGKIAESLPNQIIV
jgi:hypothetical protein